MKAHELNETADPTQQDLKHVAEWLDVEPDQLDVEVVPVPMRRFQQQAEQMYQTYDQFPQERKRTNRIRRLLQQGEPVYPVYVEADDPTMFVMEGRHRLVAFWLEGMQTIPVARVSVVPDVSA